MKPIGENQRNRFFTELVIALKREGLESMPHEDGLPTVLLDDLPLCQISSGGSIQYRTEDIHILYLTHSHIFGVVHFISLIKYR